MFSCLRKNKKNKRNINNFIIERKMQKEKEVTNNCQFIQNYKIIKRICSDSDELDKEIYIVEDIDKKYNNKYILKMKTYVSKNEYEVYKVLSLRHHPNIQQVVRMFGYNNKICFLYEYIDGQDLYEYSQNKSFTERQCQSIVKQIVDGLNFLHSLHIIHLDIKCENVLYDDINNTVKIIDFDFATIIDNPESKYVITGDLCGTEFYVAPETISSNIYSCKTDIWQLGVLLYALITNKYPCTNVLRHKCNDICQENMFRRLNMFIEQKGYDKSLFNLLVGILEYDETKRYNLDMIKESTWLNI
ncbi:MAG: serine/threonine protein kinase [Barrevirus sp.]|uniref:Serine/threonine protein kinase n=1 Tax=Barrevirus sp. TaxID=2487763 RepID=A0A3G4ZU83_9VIRU|nr:MAG: serine/threonine protein kinase [Barrevirus sp.]